MTDLDVLERLAADCLLVSDGPDARAKSRRFRAAAHPATVLSLISAARERDAMREYYEARIEVDYQLGTLAGVKRAARNRLLKAQAVIEARQALNQEQPA